MHQYYVRIEIPGDPDQQSKIKISGPKPDIEACYWAMNNLCTKFGDLALCDKTCTDENSSETNLCNNGPEVDELSNFEGDNSNNFASSKELAEKFNEIQITFNGIQEELQATSSLSSASSMLAGFEDINLEILKYGECIQSFEESTQDNDKIIELREAWKTIKENSEKLKIQLTADIDIAQNLVANGNSIIDGLQKLFEKVVCRENSGDALSASIKFESLKSEASILKSQLEKAKYMNGREDGKLMEQLISKLNDLLVDDALFDQEKFDKLLHQNVLLMKNKLESYKVVTSFDFNSWSKVLQDLGCSVLPQLPHKRISAFKKHGKTYTMFDYEEIGAKNCRRCYLKYFGPAGRYIDLEFRKKVKFVQQK